MTTTTDQTPADEEPEALYSHAPMPGDVRHCFRCGASVEDGRCIVPPPLFKEGDRVTWYSYAGRYWAVGTVESVDTLRAPQKREAKVRNDRPAGTGVSWSHVRLDSLLYEKAAQEQPEFDRSGICAHVDGDRTYIGTTAPDHQPGAIVRYDENSDFDKIRSVIPRFKKAEVALPAPYAFTFPLILSFNDPKSVRLLIDVLSGVAENLELTWSPEELRAIHSH